MEYMTSLLHRAIQGTVSNKFLDIFIIYNIAIFLTFMLIYRFIGFEKHFILPAHIHTVDMNVIAYYTFMTQSAVMSGEISPKTKLARSILVTHVFLSWIIIVAFIVPWNVSSTNM